MHKSLPDGRLTTRAMYLTATSSFDLMCFMSLISPFRPAPSSPTCGDMSPSHSQSLMFPPGRPPSLQACSRCMGMSLHVPAAQQHCPHSGMAKHVG